MIIIGAFVLVNIARLTNAASTRDLITTTVRNSSGELIINQNVNFKFNVMQNTTRVFLKLILPTDDLGAVNLVMGHRNYRNIF
jgi:hypothetical protein